MLRSSACFDTTNEFHTHLSTMKGKGGRLKRLSCNQLLSTDPMQQQGLMPY